MCEVSALLLIFLFIIHVVRCMLDKDPIAQRHMAKINKYRGEYDKWGNRLTR